MDMKGDMMSDAIDDVMDDEEDEEEEGDKILKEVLDEIGVDLSQKVSYALISSTRLVHYYSPNNQLTDAPIGIAAASSPLANRQAVALGESAPTSGSRPDTGSGNNAGSGEGANVTDEDSLQARLDALRRGQIPT